MKHLRASLGTLSSLKLPSNVLAVKKLFELCCQAYKDLMDADKLKLHWMRLEYSMRCKYPDFGSLLDVVSMQEMSTQCNQNIYGIFVPVEDYLSSLDVSIDLCLQKGLNSGHNAELLDKSSYKLKLISMLVRQLGVTGSNEIFLNSVYLFSRASFIFMNSLDILLTLHLFGLIL
jgi:hypothetical protein